MKKTEELLWQIEKIMRGSKCLSFEPSVCDGCEKRARLIIKAVKAATK